MTTPAPSAGTVRLVDGGWWDRLRRVDPRIWDTLLALGVVGSACWRSRCETIGRTSRRRCSGSRWWSSPAVARLAPAGSAHRRDDRVAAVATASLLGYWPEFVAMLWIAVYSAAAYTERDRWSASCSRWRCSPVAISIGERWDRGLNWVEILTDLVVTFGVPFLLGRMTFNRRRGSSASVRSRPARPSPPNGRRSPASCTTSWRTT